MVSVFSFLFGNFRPTHSLLDGSLAWTTDESEFQRGSLSHLTQLENSAAYFICRSTLRPLITPFIPVISKALLHLLSRMGMGKAAR